MGSDYSINHHRFSQGSYGRENGSVFIAQYPNTFDLVENHFYMLVLKDGTDVLFKDKVFCTNQPLVSFSVNNGQYVSSTTTNDFIIYE